MFATRMPSKVVGEIYTVEAQVAAEMFRTCQGRNVPTEVRSTANKGLSLMKMHSLLQFITPAISDHIYASIITPTNV